LGHLGEVTGDACEIKWGISCTADFVSEFNISIATLSITGFQGKTSKLVREE